MNYLSDRGKYVVDAPLIKSGFTLTIPSKIRKLLELNLQKYRLLTFVLEKDGQVSITVSENPKGKVIGSAEFISSFQITLPPYVRETLKLNKGEIVGFWNDEENKAILIRKMK